MQPRTHWPCGSCSACCTSAPPGPFPQSCSPHCRTSAHTVVHNYSGCRSWHLSLLNIVLVPVSHQLTYFCVVALLSGLFISPSTLVSPTNLARVQSFLSPRSFLKILNSIEPRIHPGKLQWWPDASWTPSHYFKKSSRLAGFPPILWSICSVHCLSITTCAWGIILETLHMFRYVHEDTRMYIKRESTGDRLMNNLWQQKLSVWKKILKIFKFHIVFALKLP